MATRARGIISEMAIAFEGTYGDPATAGTYHKVPFLTDSLGADEPFDDQPELGTGRRDAQTPSRGARDVNGDMTLPMRLDALGFWLRLLFGDPDVSGAAPDFVHTFKSGTLSALPSMVVEKKYKSGIFWVYSGVKANTLNITMSRGGFPQVTVGLIGANETKAAVTGAGTPSLVRGAKAHQFQATLKKGGTKFARVTSFEFNFSNNLDPIESVGDGGIRDAIDEGLSSATGNMSARFEDFANYDIAVNDSTIDIEMAWTIAANKSLTITLHKARLARPRQPIEGPGGVSQNFEWRAEDDISGAGQMMTVTLANQFADYTV